MRLAQQLRKKGSIRRGESSFFDWRGLGTQVGLCFCALPDHVSFLYGPLDSSYTPKERKQSRSRKKGQESVSDAEEESPDTVEQRNAS